MGADIPTDERNHLSRATISELNKRQMDVEAHRLPKLPRGVVPRGWDGRGRPWAIINCRADNIPQVTSSQGSERVTVAALVDFHPETFYVPSATALDYAMRYRSKASKKGTLACGLTLEQDGQWEDPAGTYKKFKLPTYHHSVPVQELLRSHHWPAFREGHWGNRPNPPVPEGGCAHLGKLRVNHPDLTWASHCLQLGPQIVPLHRDAHHLPHPSSSSCLSHPLTERRQPGKPWSW